MSSLLSMATTMMRTTSDYHRAEPRLLLSTSADNSACHSTHMRVKGAELCTVYNLTNRWPLLGSFCARSPLLMA